MKRLTSLICASLLAPQFASAEGCDHGLTNLAQPLMETAIALREDKKYQEAINKLKTIPEGQPTSFCILYEIGRNQLNLEDYDQALATLQSASGIASDEDRKKQAIFNIIGYTWLVKKDYGQAVLVLERQLKDDQFANLPIAKQTKVFNNTGLSYLRLNQYAPAKANFEKARANGSKLAQANLAIVESLIAVQEKGDADIPGIFSVSLHSQRGSEGLDTALNSLARQLSVSNDDLNVFRRETGMLSVTLSANLSYAKAQALQEKAIAAGVSSAQIVSTTAWENVSFDKKQAMAN